MRGDQEKRDDKFLHWQQFLATRRRKQQAMDLNKFHNVSIFHFSICKRRDFVIGNREEFLCGKKREKQKSFVDCVLIELRD